MKHSRAPDSTASMAGPGREPRRRPEQLDARPGAADHPVGHEAHAQAARQAVAQDRRDARDGETSTPRLRRVRSK